MPFVILTGYTDDEDAKGDSAGTGVQCPTSGSYLPGMIVMPYAPNRLVSEKTDGPFL